MVTVTMSPSHLSDIQRNSVNMLNWLALLTQEINAASNNRMYMEEVYSLIVNETYPNAVDIHTQDRLRGIREALERYRMNDVKRERLEYLYEQNQAESIRAAIPNPMTLLSAVQSKGLAGLAGSIVFMAADAVTSYSSQKTSQEMQYLQDGWVLEDEATEVFYSLRSDTFDYMIDIVRAYELPGMLALNEKAIDEFVSWKQKPNLTRRLQFLESNRETYQAFGSYYLTLAETYYQSGNDAACLQAVKDYEELNTRIFRRDREYAKVLPLAIIAAEREMEASAYQAYATEKVNTLLDNITGEDWALRYFAAQTCVDLYAQTKDEAYLQQAYQAGKDNVNYLLDKQMKQNAAYLAPVQEAPIPKGTSGSKAEEIKKYNQMLWEKRKTELPPVYEPLLLNCDMLFALVDLLSLTKEEKNDVENLLHTENNPLFLNAYLDSQFHIASTPVVAEADITFDGYTLVLPAWMVSDHTVITATVQDAEQSAPLGSWTLNWVDRKTEGDLSTFTARYVSEEARKYPYVPGTTVVFNVQPYVDGCAETCSFSFAVMDAKPNFIDKLGFWNGNVYFVRVE